MIYTEDYNEKELKNVGKEKKKTAEMIRTGAEKTLRKELSC